MLFHLLVLVFLKFLGQNFVYSQNNKIHANLKLYAYDPNVQFRLKFSQPVDRPIFQILLNNINLTYKFQSTTNFSDTYQMVLLSNIHTLNPSVQSYSLVFNFPLNVANGQLDLRSFILEPVKSSVTLVIPDWPAYFLLAIVYFLSLFGIIGLRLIDFIQMFILAQYQFVNTTTIYQFIGQVFLLNIREEAFYDSSYLVEISLPIIIVLTVFIVCFSIKHILKNTQSSYLLQIRHFFVYNFFLSIWSIFSMPILYKACQFIYLNNLNLIFLQNNQKTLCLIITYLNILASALYLYIMWFVLNPMANGGDKVFHQYIASEDFSRFQKLHLRTNLDNWKKRNYMILNTVRKYSVAILYFCISNLIVVLFIQQIMIMLYMNTIRPFKNDFYTLFAILTNLIILSFYMMVVYGNLYFGLSDIINTEISIDQFLLAKNIIFLIVISILSVFSGVQSVRIIFQIKYQIRLFKWLQKEKKQINFQEKANKPRKRLYTPQEIQKLVKKDSKIQQIENLTASIMFTNLSPPTRQKSIKNSPSHEKFNLFQIQMEELKPPQVFKKRSSNNKNNKKSQKQLNQQKKWKSSNLLQKLADCTKDQEFNNKKIFSQNLK